MKAGCAFVAVILALFAVLGAVVSGTRDKPQKEPIGIRGAGLGLAIRHLQPMLEERYSTSWLRDESWTHQTLAPGKYRVQGAVICTDGRETVRRQWVTEITLQGTDYHLTALFLDGVPIKLD